MRRHEVRAFAVLRHDQFQPETVAIENRVKVVRVLATEEAALNEARRLNQLNSSKDARYFVQTTKLADH